MSQLQFDLDKAFALKKLGPLHFFLGIEVHRESTGMYLNQSKYSCDLLSRIKMEASKSCPRPMNNTSTLSVNEGVLFYDPTLNRSTAVLSHISR